MGGETEVKGKKGLSLGRERKFEIKRKNRKKIEKSEVNRVAKEDKGFIRVHPSAVIGKNASIGRGTVVWAFAQVGEKAAVGKNCVLGNGCYIDRTCQVGDNVKVMNKALVYRGCGIGDNVFVGPGAVIANDKTPRVEKTREFDGVEWSIGEHATIGANATVLPDVNIGRNATVGAGSVVTAHVPDHGLAYGNPAKLHGFVCECGEKALLEKEGKETCLMKCSKCGKSFSVKSEDYKRIEK
ncbi:MAG: N-acetyltransferase [Candidatus Diapherotrites archaeon]|uniref:N-acetyltransferase n=1 Tax=Candidatus Iainarchaeum sp. TaxID=3101447 RepID=A0A938YXX2_9ARCH|nr:N-acetyltransferase [Candidatus Diapherotrites archaeon]